MFTNRQAIVNLSQIIPDVAKPFLRKVRRFVVGFKYIGSGRYCPVCNRNSRKFGNEGIIPRKDAKCFYCGSLERHRLVWLYFKRETNLFSGIPLKMLHVAPEAIFSEKLRTQSGINYLTADLYNPAAMVKMDITNIQYPDESFDVIYCCHVLEHVIDDKKAMREFFRVLKKGGWAVLLVPINAEKTFEDFSIIEPVERLKYFGDPTHVRLYGPDYIDRLREAGFNVRMILPSDFLSRDEIERMAITPAAGEIYYCTKWATSGPFSSDQIIMKNGAW
jgi:SAM-dependent methyltransferase